MNDPAQQLPEHHGPESSVTGVSGVHTRRLRSLSVGASSIPPALLLSARPPLQRIGDRLARISDLQWVVAMALLAPMVGFATYLALDILAEVPSSTAKAADAKTVHDVGAEPEPDPGMEFDLDRVPPPAAAVPSEPSATMSAAEHLSLADGLRTQGHHGRARHNYSLALRIDPDNRWAMVGMIRSLLAETRLSRALEWSRRLNRESPRWTTSHLMRGNILARQGDLRGARASWSRALELSPRNAEARRRLAETENPY